MKIDLPVIYDDIPPAGKRQIREAYIERQEGRCYYCDGPLKEAPPEEIKNIKINWNLFPPGFLRNPVHLHHNHNTGWTLGAVHAYCNAVLWQYHGE